MGFTTGFLGGFTLTTTLLYISLAVHERTRLRQAQLLARQSALLNNLVSPPAPVAPSTARTSQAGLPERLKERWNRELEGNMRKVYSVDWRGVREEVEDRIAGVWGRAMVGTREGVEQGVQQIEAVAKKS